MSLRESGGSKRKSGAPDFFRLPYGAKAVFRIPAVYFTPAFAKAYENGIPAGIPVVTK